MPNTPIYGFRFEDPDEQSGVSLTGGASGTEQILAEQVETEIARVETNITSNDQDIAALDDRVTDIEDNGVLGWTYITHVANNSGSPIDIDLTDGGRFPVGTFDMIRIHQQYDLDALGWIFLQINANANPSYVTGSITFDANGDEDFALYTGVGTSWRIGFGSTVSTSSLICTLMGTSIDTLTSYQSESTRQHNSDQSAHARTHHWGALSANLGAAANSLRLVVGAGATTFTFTRYWVEGFKIP